MIARGSPSIDGDVAEWQRFGAVPVVMTKTKGQDPAAQTLRAWYPWEKFTQSGPEFAAEVAFASDDANLYMMARVKDKSAGAPATQPGWRGASRTLMQSILSGKQLHSFQNPPGDFVYNIPGSSPGGTGAGVELVLGPLNRANTDWVQKYELFPPTHPLHRMSSYYSAAYHYDIYPAEGGLSEILRLRTPDFSYIHPTPLDYKWMAEHCRVDGAQVKVTARDGGYIYEAAIPWSELKQVPHGPGQRIRLCFRVRSGEKHSNLIWSQGRSIAGMSSIDWDNLNGHLVWSAETEFSFAGK